MTDCLRLIALLSDAFGGQGGIAQHNRHLLVALCRHPFVEEVIALPRVIAGPLSPLPVGLDYRTRAANGKPAYCKEMARLMRNQRRAPGALILCGHLNLLPLAAFLAAEHRARLLQVVHGHEAWPRPGPLKRRLVRRVDRLVSVSDFTRRRVQAWSGLPDEKAVVIPNAIDPVQFTPGPKRTDLLDRYGLEGKRILLTVGRLSAGERYKGHDEMLEVLPDLVKEISEIAYLIVGEGDDRPRLEAKAQRLGLGSRVVFAGYVPEAEKVDHYRLADAFVMPGRGEGFGIVYLEALACGVPVLASSADASKEAVLNGELGIVVDPGDPACLKEGIRAALRGPSGRVPARLAYFSYDRFQERWHHCLNQLLEVPGSVAATPVA